MNIDERIEALTQSVELIAAMHQDLEKKWDERMAEFDRKWDERLGKMLDIQERMGRIIEIHQEPIDGHDQRLDKLEH